MPGTYINMGTADDWPKIYDKILASDIIIFATPIWWNNHSSIIKRIIERLDEVYDMIDEGKDSPLEGKLGGVIVTGDSDGVEHITGNIANFFSCIGITVPAYCSLDVIWDGHSKKEKNTKTRFLKYYKREYVKDAKAMAASFAKLGSKS